MWQQQQAKMLGVQFSLVGRDLKGEKPLDD
jgi:hypothetical protein